MAGSGRDQQRHQRAQAPVARFIEAPPQRARSQIDQQLRHGRHRIDAEGGQTWLEQFALQRGLPQPGQTRARGIRIARLAEDHGREMLRDRTPLLLQALM